MTALLGLAMSGHNSHQFPARTQFPENPDLLPYTKGLPVRGCTWERKKAAQTARFSGSLLSGETSHKNIFCFLSEKNDVPAGRQVSRLFIAHPFQGHNLEATVPFNTFQDSFLKPPTCHLPELHPLRELVAADIMVIANLVRYLKSFR